MVKDKGRVSTKKKIHEPAAVSLRRKFPFEVNWKGRGKADLIWTKPFTVHGVDAVSKLSVELFNVLL